MTATSPYAARGYRWYVLGLLVFAYGLHALDRTLPNILIEPIRHEFKLADRQLGLFVGLSYALTFSLAVLPMGFAADRMSRRNLLAGVLVLWSLCTALGGVARDFIHLLLARMGVGVGEAGGPAAIMPMVADIFPAERRAAVLGLLYMVGGVGIFAANVLGGYVAAAFGWRAAFFIAGVPGLLLAAAIFLTVKEPARGGADLDDAPAKTAAFKEVFLHLGRNPGMICVMVGGALFGMINISIVAWSASFFMRVHGVSLAHSGLIMGFAIGAAMMLGPMAQGWLADRLASRNRLLPLWIVVTCAGFSMATNLWMLFTPSLVLAIALIMLTELARGGYAPVVYSVLLNHSPANLRGAITSTMQLITNIFGYGVGPVCVGLLSDLFGGGAALRYAMATLVCFSLLVALLVATGAWLMGRRQAAAAAT